MLWSRCFVTCGARSIQPKLQPVRQGKVVHLKRWTRFFETFPVGPNLSTKFWTEISGNFGWMDRAHCLTRPVPNGRRRSGFWLVPENLCFSGTNQQGEMPHFKKLGYGRSLGLVRRNDAGLVNPLFHWHNLLNLFACPPEKVLLIKTC